MELDVHRRPIAEAGGNACAGSGTSVYSESSVDVALALIYIKYLRQPSSRSLGGAFAKND
ncbi:hypothetical protein V0M98_13830 [Pseudomonas silesiensis]|uniref:hypothetical protein n=1 Tax=Pseudomonas silesiensis TaxID=1853130 RepID=UPI0030D2CDB6